MGDNLPLENRIDCPIQIVEFPFLLSRLRAILPGAAFRGAGMSHQFRLTQEIRIKDVTPFAIEVDYSSEPKLDEESE